jgi:hypothetical protein
MWLIPLIRAAKRGLDALALIETPSDVEGVRVF